MGFEPTTTGITIRDSNRLSYAHHNFVCADTTIPRNPDAATPLKNPALFSKCGAPDRNRTCNPQLRRLVLYPVELRAPCSSAAPSSPRARLYRQYGRGRGIRTPDNLLPKQVRYQAALYPGDSVTVRLAITPCKEAGQCSTSTRARAQNIRAGSPGVNAFA